MLLLVVLGTAAIFSPTLSQPARSDVFDESEYQLPLYRNRNEWGEALERPYKGVDIGHFLRDVESLKSSSWYPQQRRYGKLGDSPGVQLFKANKKFDGMRYAADKRNFDEIDRSGFNGFIKRNFDEIDRSGFNSLVKKNFDEIDRHGFNSFVKRSANDLESSKH